MEEAFPGVPSIGAVGQSYGDCETNEEGVTVIGLFDGIRAVANVVEELSVMPVKYIGRIEADLKTVDAKKENTVCFDFCTGDDSKVVTTFNSILKKKKIPFVGGTSNSTAVAMNGKIYEDSCVYLMLKNERGKVKVYKENHPGWKGLEGIGACISTVTEHGETTTAISYAIYSREGMGAKEYGD